MSGWRQAWFGWRNRLLSDARFQRWAAEFPLTRPIAARRTEQLFDIVAGFVYSQTLFACVRLDLFRTLARGPLEAREVAARGGLSVEAAERLLEAARALRLLDRLDAARYVLGPHGAALLGNAGILDMISHHDRLYADLKDPLALLREGHGALSAYWPYATSAQPSAATPEGVGPYSALMAATQPAVAADVLHAYPVGRHKRLLDVGGGEGVFLTAAGASAPDLRLMMFDLPAVAGRARRRLADAGLSERAEIAEGDFHSDPLPTGADLITLIRILHDQDDAGVVRLLRSVRASLPENGSVLIAEPMADPEGENRVADVYFAFYLLAMGRGRARSPTALFEALKATGFTRARALKTRSPLLLRAIVASP